MRRILIVCLMLFTLTANAQGEVDTEAPQLVALALSANSVNVYATEVRPVVMAHATDDLSGVMHIQITILHENGDIGRGVILWWPDQLISGTGRDGIYEATFSVPQHSPPGVWAVSRVRLEDRVGNVRELEGEDLEKYDTEVVIVNGVELWYIPLIIRRES